MKDTTKYLLIFFVAIFINVIAFISQICFGVKCCIAILILFFCIIKQKGLSLKLCKVLGVSSSMIIIFWGFCDKFFLSQNCLAALTKLWLLMLTGYMLAIMTSVDELINVMFYVNVESSFILFVVVIYNSLYYFFDAYKTINYGYELRFGEKQYLRKNFRILLTMCIDFMMLLSECEKICEFEQDRIISSIEKRRDRNYC